MSTEKRVNIGMIGGRLVANRQPMVPNFGDGTRMQQLLDAVIESSETGCWVKTEPRSS